MSSYRNNSHRHITVSLEAVLIGVMITWYILPVVKYYVKDAQAMVLCFITCLFLCKTKRRLLNVFTRIVLVNVLLSVIVSFCNYGLTTQSFVAWFVHLQLFFSPVVFFIYIRDCLNEYEANRIYKWLFFLLFIAFISTFIGLINNPIAARALASKSVDEAVLIQWKRSNIGGFSQAYSFGLLFIVLMILLRTVQGLKRVVVLISLCALFLYFTMAQYVTLLILVVFTGLISIYYGKNESVTVTFFFGIGLIITYLLLPTVLNAIISISTSEIINRRLSEIVVYIQTGESGASIEGRLECYKAGLELFVKSPIWGVRRSIYGGNEVWHSTIIEYLVKSGIIGTIIYILHFKYVSKLAYNWLDSGEKKRCISIFVYIIALALINPIHYSHEIALVLFLLAPMTFLMHGEDFLCERYN